MNLRLLPFLVLASLAMPAAAEDWAIGGYDAVSFLSGEAKPGRPDIVTMWKDKLWHFASEDNRYEFEANPREYVPVFEGLCPVGLSEGRQLQGDPRYFAESGGQVYLLHSPQALRKFIEAPSDILQQAEATWAAIR